VLIYPAPNSVTADGVAVREEAYGVSNWFIPKPPAAKSFTARLEKIQSAGPPREIPFGKISKPVAAAPEDVDFEKAAVWRIRLPANLDLDADPILRMRYAGDVARVTLDGKLIDDDFYNGNVFEVGLRRFAPGILSGELRVAILPLRQDAPI